MIGSASTQPFRDIFINPLTIYIPRSNPHIHSKVGCVCLFSTNDKAKEQTDVDFISDTMKSPAINFLI